MTDLEAIAKDAAERVHKNGGCVPQMAYAPILFALQDAFPTHPSPSAPNPDLEGLVERLKADAKGSMLRRNWRGKGGLQRDINEAIRHLSSLK